MMKTYLINIYNSKNAKTYFLTDIVEAHNPNEAEKIIVGKKYYYDSEQKRILGQCRKAIVLHEII